MRQGNEKSKPSINTSNKDNNMVSQHYMNIMGLKVDTKK